MTMRTQGVRQTGAMIFALFASGAVTSAQSDQAATLATVKKAVEARLSPPQNTGTVRLMNVTANAVPKAGGVLALTIQPPSTEMFEFHAETTFILIWQALGKVPNAYDHIARVQLTLRHAPKAMTIDCPAEAVEDMYGFTDFARLKRLCQVR